MAQGLLQVNDDFTSYPYLCKGVAIAMHYFWLSTFTLQNTLSYRMYKTFTDLTFYQTYKNKKNTIKYLMYAWLSPVIIILPCFMLDIMGTQWFQYGNRNHCWISNIQNNILLYTFGCPVAFLVITNIILLAKCAASLCITFKDISFDYRVNQRQIFRTYSSLFFFSGLTWLLGFLPALTGNDLYWYPFVISNAFQGFFIFLIFGLPHLKCK